MATIPKREVHKGAAPLDRGGVGPAVGGVKAPMVGFARTLVNPARLLATNSEHHPVNRAIQPGRATSLPSSRQQRSRRWRLDFGVSCQRTGLVTDKRRTLLCPALTAPEVAPTSDDNTRTHTISFFPLKRRVKCGAEVTYASRGVGAVLLGRARSRARHITPRGFEFSHHVRRTGWSRSIARIGPSKDCTHRTSSSQRMVIP
jgi:hypothetical protein